MSTKSRQKQINVVWGLVLVLLGGFFLAEQVGFIPDLSPGIWSLLFGIVSLLFFASYFISGFTQWGWLFPATISGGLAAIIWLANNGFDGPFLGSLILGCVSLPFWVAFLVNRKENWWALIPGWITAAIAAIILLSETLSGEIMASFILFSVALPFFIVFAVNRKHWWALIPGGIIASVGMMLFFLAPANNTRWGDEIFIALMFACVSITFIAVWLQRDGASTTWAKYPAIGFAALSLLVLLAGVEANFLWPALLIIFGGWLLLDAARRPKLKG
jgi:hypothetical protein